MTDYRYITIGFNVDFDHDGTNEYTLALTDALRADPRWLAFLEMYHEARHELELAKIAAAPTIPDDGHERGPI